MLVLVKPSKSCGDSTKEAACGPGATACRPYSPHQHIELFHCLISSCKQTQTTSAERRRGGKPKLLKVEEFSCLADKAGQVSDQPQKPTDPNKSRSRYKQIPVQFRLFISRQFTTTVKFGHQKLNSNSISCNHL